MTEFRTIAEAMSFWSRKIKPASASFKLMSTHKSFGVTFHADPHRAWGGLRLIYWTRTVTVPRSVHA